MTTNRKNLTTHLFSTAGVLAMLAILVAVYVIAGFLKARVDLTADRLYTLSEGSRTILQKLDSPVEVRLFVTQNSAVMPVALKTYAQRVEDLLLEYRKVSGGRIELKKYDPEPDSDAEEMAALDGVEGQTLASGERIYLGLAVSLLDARETIPFLFPEREKLLEYEVTRAISRVVNPEKPVVGVLSALPIFGEFNPMMMQMGQGRQNPWVFLTELKRDFEVRQVDMAADKIDDAIKVLVAFYPRDISEKAEYALDQFVLRGGKLIAFLDPLSIADSRSNPMNPMQRNLSSGASLDKLLKAWGIEFDKSKVLADLNYVTRINQGGRPSPNPAVLSLTREAVATNDIVTSQLDSLLVPFAGAFTGTPAEGLTRTVLLQSSSNSQLVEKMMAEFSGEQLVKDFASASKEFALALRLTGKFKTAFPDGAPKDPADSSTNAPPAPAPAASLKESAQETSVVLVADADMLFDQVCVQVGNFLGQRIVMPIGGNLNFIQALVEHMSGGNELIAVRGRATMSRPFTRVKAMQARAEDQFRTKIKELEKSEADIRQKLSELQVRKTDSGQRFILSPEQQDAIRNYEKEQVRVRGELKTVRKELRREIDSLETGLKWANIFGMPLLVAVGGLGLALVKRKKTAAK